MENQFFVTLIKLRLHSSNKELSILFHLAETVVSNIVVTRINFMYVTWSTVNIWPCRELIRMYMPLDFKSKFPKTRVILDGVEFPIQKPKKPLAQQATFSSYKNRNTLKSVVGISPGGLASHIPDAFGGSASDRALVERSNLLSKLDPSDSIMTDKGFQVQDIFAPSDVTVNTPLFCVRGTTFLLKVLHAIRK